MSDRLSGTVKWFDRRKGFGFIAPAEGPDVFVHYSAIRGEGYRNLSAGQNVEFSIETGPRGQQAQDVCPV
jgi:CspA family cold shock protein